MALPFPNPFAGQTVQPQQPVLPRVPWGQNPMITAAGIGLLSGRNINQGFENVAQMMPGAMVAKSGLQQFMLAKQEKDRELAETQKVKDAWNRVMIAKSSGQPIPADAQAIIAQSNPTIGAKMFGNLTGTGGDTALTGIWGTDPDGNPMIVQLTDSGTAVQTKMPEGFTPSKGVEKIDAGTEWLLYDKQTGQLVGRQPKNVAEAESLKTQGGKQGEAAVNLPIAEANADRLTSMIDAVLTDPYLPNMTGPIAGRLPNISGSAARAQSKIDQIMGGTFLQAYNDLRGGGQITEKEGEKATAAYNRLATMTMNDSDYVDALKEFRAEIVKLLDIAKRKASASPVAPGSSGSSAVTPMTAEEFMAQ